MVKVASFVCFVGMCCVFGGSSVVAEDCIVNYIAVQKDFSLNKYNGLWYELRLAPLKLPESEILKNYQQEIFVDGKGTIIVFGRARRSSECLYTKGVFQPGETLGKFTYTSFTSSYTSTHWVIETDYDNFAVVYGCQNISNDGTCAQAEAAVWSRRPTLQQNLQDKANTVLQTVCVNPATFILTPQDKPCPPKEMACPINIVCGTKPAISLIFLLGILQLMQAVIH